MLVAAVVLLARAFPAAAQGPQHERLVTADGVRLDFPPDGVWRRRARQVAAQRALLRSARSWSALNATTLGGIARAGFNGTSVAGDLPAPAVLVGYVDTDTTGLPKAAQYDSIFFTAQPLAGRPYTQRTFYEEMSNGLLHIRGQTYGWFLGVDSTNTALGACGYGVNALDCLAGRNRMYQLFNGALAAMDSAVDFGQYDNDGPDGIPNSGDDDGFVDLVQFVQPLVGGECNGAGVWAHKSSLDQLGGPYTTGDARTGGGYIRVNSYLLVAGVGGESCIDGTQIMGIGTASHELGHGLGLPDLYDVSGATQGIGEWGLMGSANYTTLLSPGHLDAWSKDQLGWVVIRELSAARAEALGPVVSGDTVFLIRPSGANPRGEYFLLENKQAVGADAPNMTVGAKATGPKVGGLLVWHVDSLKIASTLAWNAVNAGLPHGVAVVQADARADLDKTRQAGGNRGDAGDPFPGSTGNQSYACGSTPMPAKNVDAGFAGFGLASITQTVPNGAMSFQFGYSAMTTAVSQDAPVAIMGAPYAYAVPPPGEGTWGFSWTLATGQLPPGLSLLNSGLIVGTPQALGSFDATLEVCSALDVTALPLRLTVTAPDVAPERVVNQLLRVDSTLTSSEARFLDLLGNRNNRLDLGDFLAWVRTMNIRPSASVMARAVAGSEPVVPRPGPGERKP